MTSAVPTLAVNWGRKEVSSLCRNGKFRGHALLVFPSLPPHLLFKNLCSHGALNYSSLSLLELETYSPQQQHQQQQQLHNPYSMGSQFPMPADESDRRLLRLRAAVQSYDWGLKGAHSQVAALSALNSGDAVEPERPYAELWMGTHGSGPSFVIGDGGVTLKGWISENPSALGERVVERWGCDLPFLFKVLSVGKALSIQAHPDKELARTLHKTLPNLYKDANHKPEMALAITRFEALCGFVGLEELKGVLCNVPEIVELVGKSDAGIFLCVDEHDEEKTIKSALKLLFTQLMSANKELIAEAINNLKSRLHMECKVRQLTDKEQLVLRLEEQYPADVGVISAFFFNYVKLNPGEALYLGANEPHAYLSGECIECMATSDNVVRAGLTPKHRDVQTLCSMLTYKQGFPEILQGLRMSPYITRYLPPFDEFEVDHCLLPKGKHAVFPAVPGPSIFLVTSGKGAAQTKASRDVVREGDVLFAPANTEISMTSSSELQVYRAGVNSRFLADL